MITAVAITYTVTMFAFSLAFFIAWFRYRKQVIIYKTYGLIIATVLVTLELTTLALASSAGANAGLVPALGAAVGTFFRTAAFTIVGMYLCSLIGLPSFPLMMQRSGFTKAPKIDVVESSFETPSDDVPAVSIESVKETKIRVVIPSVSVREYVIPIIIVALSAVAYSVVLFLLTKPQATDLVKRSFGAPSVGNTFGTGSGIAATIIIVSIYAIGEELIFRLGIQNLLAKLLGWRDQDYWNAILLATFLWTIGHVGVMDPDWVKIVQIFPVGLALGWLFKKYGVESSIFAHMLFNVLLIIPSQYLVKF